MIYLFTGTDVERVRTKAFAWIAAARKKAPEAPYLRFSASEITEQTLSLAAGSQGLFFSKALVLLDDPFSLSEVGELIMDRLDMLSESPNPIAILAPKLVSARVKKISAKVEKTFEFDVKEKTETHRFNTALINALATRNGRALWIEIERAARLGEAPEAIHGLLHWKARDLMQKGNQKWGKEDARSLSLDLIELVSEQNRSEQGLKETLERFALSI